MIVVCGYDYESRQSSEFRFLLVVDKSVRNNLKFYRKTRVRQDKELWESFTHSENLNARATWI